MKRPVPLLRITRGSVLLAVSALALVGQTKTRPGTADPAGNPSNFTLFRDQQIFTMSPGTKASPWETAVATFDANFSNDTPSVISQLPWSPSIPVDTSNSANPVNIQAIAGRIAHPDKDDIAIVQRWESGATKLAVRFRDGSGAVLLGNLPERIQGWTDFFATSAGDLDRLYDSDGNYHDEIVTAWMETEPSTSPNQHCENFVPHVAVLNYNNGASPLVTTQRLDRPGTDYISRCDLEGYDYYEFSLPQAPSIPSNAPQPIDNVIATAVGDFDGDGYNEFAVAYMRGTGGVVISVVIYRYQNDGTDASLTPVNTLEIYRPDRSMVGTLSLAAGDFDGSGADQLLVGSAYYWGDSDGTGWVKGTFRTQPVFFLIKGGQVAASVTGAAGAGTNNVFTEFTVSLGTGAYVPRTVTLAGGTGKWAAVNGTWPITPTVNGFSIELDTSSYGSFAGQNVQFSAAAPLTQADSLETDAFPGRSGPQRLDDGDIDGRIRVQMAPGLFHFDPNHGFDYRRRQVAVTWSFRIGSESTPGNHLGIIEVTDDGKIAFAAQPADAMGSEGDDSWQMYQSFSLAAGALRGDNDTNDPTWSIFVSGLGIAFNSSLGPTAHGLVHAIWNVQPDSSDPTKLQLTKACVGKAATDGLSPAWQGVYGQICQFWGFDGRIDTLPNPVPPGAGPTVRNYLRLPAVAADLNGKSLKLGAPAHFTLSNPGKAHFILEQPPQHAAYLDLDGTGKPKVVTINRYTTFNTSLRDSSEQDFKSKNQDHTSWTVGASEKLTAQASWAAGADAGPLAKSSEESTAKLSARVSYDYDHVYNHYSSGYDAFTVGQSAATGTDDSLVVEQQILDLWRYRIYGEGTDTGDANNPNAFYDIVIPGPSLLASPGGRDVDWYQPQHEAGNILSYPGRTDVCSPPDIGPITIPNLSISDQVIPLISCQQVFYDGNSRSLSLQLDHQTGSGDSTDYTNKVSTGLDFKYTYRVDFELLGNGGQVKASTDTDVHGGANWGHLTTSDSSATDATGITLNSPQGDAEHAYAYYPIFYNTEAGGLKVAYGVDDLRASVAGSAFWTAHYGAKPDPALNLPNRFAATYNANGAVNGWQPVNTAVRKRMKGFAVRKATTNAVTGNYDLLGSNAKDGDTVMLEARVYNYSISSTPTGPVTVQFSVIPYDSETDNEICPGIPNTGSGRVCPPSARTVIGNGSSAPTGGVQTVSLNSRENKLVYLKWNTKGFGPKVEGAFNEYRVYVNLIPDPNGPGELYPPEEPCTTIPCEDNLGNQKKVDPGQNNEGWSLIAVAAPPSPSALGPRHSQLTHGTLTARGPLPNSAQPSTVYAFLFRPLHLRLKAFSNAHSDFHYHVTIFDGQPGETGTETIAIKTVRGTHQNGSSVVFDWTPLTTGPHHLYAVMQDTDGVKSLGELVVNVGRAPGNLNGDGRVDRHDLNILERDLGQDVAESACGAECDFDGDGKITEKDEVLLGQLCDSRQCAFDQPEYVDGRPTPQEPDMRAVRSAEHAATTAWLAAHPKDINLVEAVRARFSGPEAYQAELKHKEGMRNIRYYYKGKPVTSGPLAPRP